MRSVSFTSTRAVGVTAAEDNRQHVQRTVGGVDDENVRRVARADRLDVCCGCDLHGLLQSAVQQQLGVGSLASQREHVSGERSVVGR